MPDVPETTRISQYAPAEQRAASEVPAASGFPGLITRENEPQNLEFPFPSLAGRLTPTSQFYIRSHFPIPDLSVEGWRLTINGAVEHELTLTYDELRQLPATTVSATLECAGNGRARLAPKPKGLLWEQGAVGNAEWTGVPLTVLLARAGVKAEAIEVVFEGADRGEINEDPKSPGAIHFARSLPLAKAQQGEVLVVYAMNGQPLPPEHGFPVRLVVPGWYGMASIKWLTTITVSTVPFDGYWQTIEYAYWQRTQGHPTMTPVAEMQVKAEIARPMLHEALAAGVPYRVHGAAWTGEGAIAKVEVSTDGGGTWQPATLLEQDVPFTWRLWEYHWAPAAAGRHKLLARATDEQGQTQPLEHSKDRRTYMINRVASVEVLVQ
ncbi:sulfite oxidase [Hymenobacter sp. BT186]|uniref:Sulfite oxidase n=1 Tax=Hymenobacter telluris TaxID=2816474 RepID=A0A939EVQ6_9BACT|nr:sulfite oxidase [Hymenobacter telluris]MBO0357906.1 sulfite oxidase [Hymenobacter telluris]MBW3373933.1 sulfite oxidase [Hymenobacter norwichensis]